MEPHLLLIGTIFHCVFGLPELFGSPQGTLGRCPSDPFGPTAMQTTHEPVRSVTKKSRIFFNISVAPSVTLYFCPWSLLDVT